MRLLVLVTLLFAFADSAVAIDTQRSDVAHFIDDMTQKHNFRRSELRSLLRNAEFKPSIVETMSHPAEQVFPWYRYRERLLTDKRITKGVDFWNKQAAILQRAYDTTGVSPEAIVGILGIETTFGEDAGRFRVLDALSTLAFYYPPRAEFFSGELEQFLLLTREEKVDARKVLGSYAGAIGAPQFMPSNYRRLAVDGDGNGRRDLWNSWPDIVMSVANYLKTSGWKADQPVTVSANVAAEEFAKFKIDPSSMRLDETVGSLRAKGVRFETTLPNDTPATLVVGESPDGDEYRVGFNNFLMIRRYNKSIKYALAVQDLGTAIARARQDAAQ
jgi:membrane-bound lytic murein transglycosylase B